jgi:methyltransferase
VIGLAQIVALLVAAQRLAELAYARRNTKRLLAAGGVEHGAGHYPPIVALHVAWLAALFVLVPPGTAADWGLLGLYGLLQLGRLWVITSLGARWTTRVIAVPGAARVAAGPYRFLRHPNYLIVALEIPLLPMAFGAWQLALGFGLANLALLAHRVRIEERALAAQESAIPESVAGPQRSGSVKPWGNGSSGSQPNS